MVDENLSGIGVNLKIDKIEKSKNQLCYYRVRPLIGEDHSLNQKFFYGPELNLVARIRD